ncbi:hypothetical protein VSQ78_03720 [Nocardiopsis alba]|uniref:Uncharacterized protein n=1 Tax=Nocardiopsis alba TaxID=53437 RepID=A0ABV5DQD1_9ACTN
MLEVDCAGRRGGGTGEVGETGEADRNTGAGGVLGAGRAAEARRAGREGRGAGAGGTLGATGVSEVSGTVEDGDTGRSARPDVGRKPAQWVNRRRSPNQPLRTFGMTGVAVVVSGGTKIPCRAGRTPVVVSGGVNVVVGGRVRRTCVGIMLTVFSLVLVREVRSGL